MIEGYYDPTLLQGPGQPSAASPSAMADRYLGLLRAAIQPLPSAITPQVCSHRTNMFQALPVEITTNWPAVIGELAVPLANRELIVETAARDTSAETDWRMVLLTGKAGGYDFAAALEIGLVNLVMQAQDPDLVLLPEHTEEAACLLEHILAPLVEVLESHIGISIGIEHALVVERLPQHEWLHLIAGYGAENYRLVVAVPDNLQSWLGNFVHGNANGYEKAIEKRLSVRVGPVTLSRDLADNLSAGTCISTGLKPNGRVQGTLMRSDGRYWPVIIDDSSVKIDYDLMPAMNLLEQHDIWACFEIGMVEMPHSTRIKIARGDSLDINRITGGATRIWLNGQPAGWGTFDLVGGVIAVRVVNVDLSAKTLGVPLATMQSAHNNFSHMPSAAW